jgi:deoxyribodipyrimidine photolyase-related protein
MSFFLQELNKRQKDPKGRRWVYVPYDQITDRVGPLSRENPNNLGIVLVENPWKASRRPYHKQKLALILGNLRHFALEQARRGVAIRHVVARGPYRTVLDSLAKELGPMQVMEPAERELRVDLEPLVKAKAMEFVPHEGWLTNRDQFFSGAGGSPPWRMDSFYRHMRRETGILMKGGMLEGGKVSFDQENPLPWQGDPPAPSPPSFPRDPVKEEVGRLIGQALSSPGKARPGPSAGDCYRCPETLALGEEELPAPFRPLQGCYVYSINRSWKRIFPPRIFDFASLGPCGAVAGGPYSARA